MPINEAFVSRLADRRQEVLQELERTHDKRLDKALRKTEREIVKAANELPTRKGVLFDARASIAIRAKLLQIMEKEFVGWAHDSVDDYSRSAKVIRDNFGDLGYSKSLTDIDKETIKQLKMVAFQGFEDIAKATVGQIGDELYLSTIAGRSFDEISQTIAKAVNGVHARGIDSEADELVSFIEKHRDDPAKAALVAKAAEELHTIHGRDVVGNNLRRYASQMAHDSLMQFDASYNVAKAKEVGLNYFRYSGTSIKDTRDWCEEHIDRVMSEDEIRDEWANNTWGGKAPGDPFIVRGGYNCRHHWQPVDPDWFE